MFAYPDSKCCFGYMTICDACVTNSHVPQHVDLKNPIERPPALYKKQKCEVCGGMYILLPFKKENDDG